MSGLFSFARCGTGSVLASTVFSHAQQRGISSSAVVFGKRNIRKFFLGNKRGTKLWRRDRNKGLFDYAPVYTEVRDTGYKYEDVYHEVPELIPEIIVPDLTGCQLKPYVSYKAADIYQSEFAAQDLFDIVYANKIKKDFEENKLDEDGIPLEPSEMEKMTPEAAWTLARKSGSDLFSERKPRLWECLEKSLIDDEPTMMKLSSYDLTHPSETKKELSGTSLDPQLLPPISLDSKST